MKNKKSIFFMEKTYKIFGRTHDSLMKKKVNFGEYQCVKKKQRSTITIDHIFFVKKSLHIIKKVLNKILTCLLEMIRNISINYVYKIA